MGKLFGGKREKTAMWIGGALEGKRPRPLAPLQETLIGQGFLKRGQQPRAQHAVDIGLQSRAAWTPFVTVGENYAPPAEIILEGKNT